MHTPVNTLIAMYGRIAEQALEQERVWLALWAVIEKMKFQEMNNDGTV